MALRWRVIKKKSETTLNENEVILRADNAIRVLVWDTRIFHVNKTMSRS